MVDDGPPQLARGGPAGACRHHGGRPVDEETALNTTGQSEAPRLDATSVPAPDGADIDLTQVTGDAPAAALLVDLRSREVVYADPVAEHLAPGVRLPAALDAWSDAAALRDLDGAELSDTQHPLSLVAQSRPVTGQAVSAARESELGRHREPLWVVALPLSGAPQLEDHALVVFLPLADRESAQAAATAARAQADLRDRAVLATGMSFTMADAQAPDMPLIWVNPAFTATTGYSFEEAVGANCRFLQGPGTDPAAPAAMRRALEAGEPVTVTLLNHRKDGTAFWNQVAMSPIHGPDGVLTHYVGIQTDVTGRVTADRERDRALAAERAARRDAEHARAQLELLAEATSRLAATLDVRESLDRLASLVVPLLADWVVLVTADRGGGAGRVLAHHRDGRHEEMAAFAARLGAGARPGWIVQQLLEGAPAQRADHYSSPEQRARRRAWVDDPALLDTSDALGAESVLFVPLPGRDHVDGVMILLRGQDSPAHTDADLAVATDLGRRAGLILDNARLYQGEHRIAEALQRSLLPDLPAIPGVRAAARYRASETGAAVGGDFYELIPLPGGAIGLAIGDVVGHDVLAAAAMGHLRGLLRACAWDDLDPDAAPGSWPDPAAVLDRVDQLLDGLGITTMATVAYACLEPRDDGAWLLRHASAGHPPLVLRSPDGGAEALDGTADLLLGVQPTTRTSTARLVPAGSTLVAFTDGLVERRGEHLATGLERLAAAVAQAPVDVEALCDHLLAACADGSEDDVALLAVQL